MRCMGGWLAGRGLLPWWGSVGEGRAGSGGTAVGAVEADCWAVGDEGERVGEIGWCIGEAAA